jgi:hypothetical protein
MVEFGAWNLECIWSLELEIWILTDTYKIES